MVVVVVVVVVVVEVIREFFGGVSVAATGQLYQKMPLKLNLSGTVL